MSHDLAELTKQARDALDSPGKTHGGAQDDALRYELFHAASSICS